MEERAISFFSVHSAKHSNRWELKNPFWESALNFLIRSVMRPCVVWMRKVNEDDGEDWMDRVWFDRPRQRSLALIQDQDNTRACLLSSTASKFDASAHYWSGQFRLVRSSNQTIHCSSTIIYLFLLFAPQDQDALPGSSPMVSRSHSRRSRHRRLSNRVRW